MENEAHDLLCYKVALWKMKLMTTLQRLHYGNEAHDYSATMSVCLYYAATDELLQLMEMRFLK